MLNNKVNRKMMRIVSFFMMVVFVLLIPLFSFHPTSWSLECWSWEQYTMGKDMCVGQPPFCPYQYGIWTLQQPCFMIAPGYGGFLSCINTHNYIGTSNTVFENDDSCMVGCWQILRCKLWLLTCEIDWYPMEECFAHTEGGNCG